jgi:hypothetical protein
MNLMPVTRYITMSINNVHGIGLLRVYVFLRREELVCALISECAIGIWSEVKCVKACKDYLSTQNNWNCSRLIPGNDVHSSVISRQEYMTGYQ